MQSIHHVVIDPTSRLKPVTRARRPEFVERSDFEFRFDDQRLFRDDWQSGIGIFGDLAPLLPFDRVVLTHRALGVNSSAGVDGLVTDRTPCACSRRCMIMFRGSQCVLMVL